MASIGHQRLQQLAQHLRDIVTDEQWDYGSYIQTKNICGTIGCGLGHANDLWPDRFPITTDNYGEEGIFYIFCDNEDELDIACEFFDIPGQIAYNIFIYGIPFNAEDDVIELRSITSRLGVAENIENYLKEAANE